MIGRWHGLMYDVDEEIAKLQETIKKAKLRLKYLKERKEAYQKKYDETSQ